MGRMPMEQEREAAPSSSVVVWTPLSGSCIKKVLFAWTIVFSLDLYETLMKYTSERMVPKITLAFASC